MQPAFFTGLYTGWHGPSGWVGSSAGGGCFDLHKHQSTVAM